MRSKLFVPASRADFFQKALASDADALSFDLEDSVEESRKAEARAALASFLASPDLQTNGGKRLIVRINASTTPHFEADVEAVTLPTLDTVNLPMVERESEVHELARLLDRFEARRGLTRPIGILVNIESPRGLRRAADLANCHPRVNGLQIGYGDLFGPAGIDPTDPDASQHVRLQVRLAAAEGRVAAYDGAHTNIRDLEGFRRSCAAAARLGFAGKSCIHPTQIAAANEIFRPDPEAVAHARRVVAAADDHLARGVGAFSVDGQLIDGPLIDRARLLLARVDRA
jgi:citrate lyase subunit beta/citryl-CoA lyase